MKWTSALLSGSLALCLGGCALYPLESNQEVQVDSVTLPPNLTYGIVGSPFCLHLSYRNAFMVAYSQHKVQSWTTDGSCASQGAKRKLDTLALSWRYADQVQQDKQCLSADTCVMDERRIIEGRLIECVSARARHGDQTAFISTDQVRCR